MPTLYKHQMDAARFAVENNGCVGLFHDPGCGKTLTTLEIFRYYRQQNPGLRMLVVCPLSLVRAAWGEDTAKFTDFKYLPYSDVKNVPRGRPGCLLDADILGINFESLIVEKRFAEISGIMRAGAWMLVVDESSRMKSHKSITTKELLKLAPLARHRIVLSGTPCPNGEYELWAQAKFVNPDSLPDSFYAFRNNYFHLSRGNQVMVAPQGRVMTRGMMAQIFQQGWKYAITDDKRKELMARIMPFSNWVKKEDALDLPEKIDEVRLVRMNPNERKLYNEMKNHLVAEIKVKKKTEVVTAEVALSKLMKLREITSGFVLNEAHDALRPGRSSKMRELAEVIEEIGPRQAIIWIQFKEEVRVITEMLAEDGKTFSTLYSGTEDREKSIKDFQSGASQFLVAHGLSAAHGLTFVNSNISIYFSLSYSLEQYLQSRDRQHRIGQKNAVTYIHLLAENTIDELIMSVLQKKKSLQDILYLLTQEEY